MFYFESKDHYGLEVLSLEERLYFGRKHGEQLFLDCSQMQWAEAGKVYFWDRRAKDYDVGLDGLNIYLDGSYLESFAQSR